MLPNLIVELTIDLESVFLKPLKSSYSRDTYSVSYSKQDPVHSKKPNPLITVLPGYRKINVLKNIKLYPNVQHSESKC